MKYAAIFMILLVAVGLVLGVYAYANARLTVADISVSEAPGTKCPRCWMHSTEADSETGLCPRCARVLAEA